MLQGPFDAAEWLALYAIVIVAGHITGDAFLYRSPQQLTNALPGVFAFDVPKRQVKRAEGVHEITVTPLVIGRAHKDVVEALNAARVLPDEQALQVQLNAQRADHTAHRRIADAFYADVRFNFDN